MYLLKQRWNSIKTIVDSFCALLFGICPNYKCICPNYKNISKQRRNSIKTILDSFCALFFVQLPAGSQSPLIFNSLNWERFKCIQMKNMKNIFKKCIFRNTFVMFAKEIFDYPELEEHPLLCNHLGKR